MKQKTKATLLSAIVLALVFGAVGVGARDGGNGIDFSKPLELKVGDFKINKKQVLSEDQKKLLDEMAKAKTGDKGGRAKPTPPPLSGFGGPTGALGASLPTGAKKHAVVIGLSNYAGTSSDLCVVQTSSADLNNPCADGDSTNMQNVLKAAQFDDIAFSRDSGVSFAGIQAAVETIMSTANKDDEIVFFFSGHSTSTTRDLFKDGIRNHLGLALYGAPVDGTQVIWDEQLRSWFSGSLPTQRVIFIFDTCHAGAFESYLQGDNREVVMSSTAAQSSYTLTSGGENGAPGEGLFAHYFSVEGIMNGKADGNSPSGTHDGYQAIEEAEKYASLMISGTQIPVLDDRFMGDLALGI